jgi:hypothetical protein
MESQSLKKEFFEKLESGIEDFAAAGANLNHAKSFLSGNVVSNASKCVFEGNVLSKKTIVAEPEFLKSEFDRIGKTWVENDFTTDPSKYTTLYTFIETFNSIAHNWREISDQMINEIDILKSGSFPETLKGHFETQPCLQISSHEMVEIRNCASGKNNFICELEFRYPNATTQYVKMKILNYGGVQLAGESENLIYAKDPQTQRLVLLNCSHREYVNEKIPLCSRMENVDTCLTKILHRDYADAIKNCEFTFAEPEFSERLFDESILVSKQTAQVSENNRLIFKTPPLIIYSNYEVLITVNDDEILYPPTVSFENQAILTTKLSASEIAAMWGKAAWDVYIKGFKWEDYLDFIAIGLQAVFIPVALCGCCLSCRGRNSSKADRVMKRKMEARMKRRFEENRALLNNPPGRIIAS